MTQITIDIQQMLSTENVADETMPKEKDRELIQEKIRLERKWKESIESTSEYVTPSKMLSYIETSEDPEILSYKERLETVKTSLHRSSYEIERQERLEYIVSQVDHGDMIASLKWMAYKGEIEDVDILINTRHKIENDSIILQLIDHAIKKIAERDLEKKSRTRIDTLVRMTIPLSNESIEDIAEMREMIEQYAIEVMEDNANDWLDSPCPDLDNLVPSALLVTTEGCKLVKTMLGRIDHGVYA